MKKCILLFLILSISSCGRVSRELQPPICAPPHPKEVFREKRGHLSLPTCFSVSPFLPLTEEESHSDWGKEYQIALAFAEDFDLYRAITGFKRALFFIPATLKERRLEIEYAEMLSYYLGKKYTETIYIVESTDLASTDSSFPAFSDLLLILYDSYEQLGKCDHAAQIGKLIEEKEPEKAKKLALLTALKKADMAALRMEAQNSCDHAYFEKIVSSYEQGAKSINKAQILNAVFPGAGYWYVGLKESAVTSFMVNALFIAAATQFFIHGYQAAGAITLSLEGGWYFGGIYGAGLAAKSYNENLYAQFSQKITQREQLFPLFMLKYTF